MGRRDTYEPAYPQSSAEVEEYCSRFITALQTSLGERLVCVLLSGSWVRGEAQPPQSDVDLTVIVDTCDDTAIDALKAAWVDSGVGGANIYGSDEVPLMSRIAVHMYTTSARILYGRTPFLPPTRQDLAEDVALAAETLARNARSLEIYPWLTSDERATSLEYMLSKHDLKRALENLVAFRAGTFPRNARELEEELSNTAEGDLWRWVQSLDAAQRLEHSDTIARRCGMLAREWFQEIAPYRNHKTN